MIRSLDVSLAGRFVRWMCSLPTFLFGKDATTLNCRRQQLALSGTRAPRWPRALVECARCWSLLLAIHAASASAQIQLPTANQDEPIIVHAERGSRWQEGSLEVWHLWGNCSIGQGPILAHSREAVLWIQRSGRGGLLPDKIVAYLEGDATISYAPGRPHSRVVAGWLLERFYSTAPIQIRLPVVDVPPQTTPAIYQRAVETRRTRGKPSVQQTQFVPPSGADSALGAGRLGPPVHNGAATPPGTRRIDIGSRGTGRFQARAQLDPQTNQWVAQISGGVNLVVSGLDEFGVIDVSTDRLVVWTDEELNFSGTSFQNRELPLELYMEGNIVFRQGDRVIYARSMYYDVSGERGIVLAAEVLTPVPDNQGLLRLKADVLRQLDRHNFLAEGASLTTSRLGVPQYWFQSQSIMFQDIQQPRINPHTGQIEIDLQTGEPFTNHQIMATSRNNFLYLGGVPVFYWPVLATDARKPSFYLDRVSIKNDSIFGTQVLTNWDMYQILGVSNPPPGTEWTSSLDLLSQRGFGFGTRLDYDMPDMIGNPSAMRGLFDAWGIEDRDVDNLGRDRRGVPTEQDFRGRILWQHRQRVHGDLQFNAEFGLISDRNFLEQFYEREWDQWKDQSTGFELKRILDNSSWSFRSSARVNEFFTQTEWLPRLDHFLLGQPLLWDRLSWYAHSHVGYARFRTATTPSNPVDMAKFVPLAWEGALGVDHEGIRTATRQEIDWPFQVGVVKVVPYVLGELAHWNEDLAGDDVTRAYGQMGLRASMPMWRADPSIQSTLFNLNGLAHKVVFRGEYLWADANRNLGRFPLYDRLDDNSIEHFRRRFVIDTFGGMLPAKFDERFYALRSGMQSSVTASSTEIADDLQLVRLGARQRWQTRRGMPGQERIVDWIVLDVEGTIFPKPGRDNFGQNVGLVNYDFRWHVGDRLTLLSDGYADFFGDGLRVVTVGGFITRPEVGELYVGFRSLEGPISSNILGTSFNYRMSDKWIATFGTSIDFGKTGNIGQNLSLTRIGESLLVSVGFSADASRGNVGVHLAIEPRLLARSRRALLGRVPIAPPGSYGLE